MPRTDECNYCTECTVKLMTNKMNMCRVICKSHLQKFIAHKELKNNIIFSSKDQTNNIVTEFEYT